MGSTLNMVGGGGGGIKLQSIAITTPPTKTQYLPGETFNPAGMVVQATYSNGATLVATGYSYTPDGALTEGTTSVTIMYTEGGKTATATQAITVQRGTISVPTQSGSLTYNGAAQSPTWSGYDASKMTLGGTTSGVNAGSYTATFTPTYQYQWPDGTTTAKNVTWTIGKATGKVTLNPTSITLNADNPTDTIAVTRLGTGAITAQSNNTSAVSVSVSGTTVTVSNVNQTNGDATVTVSVADDGNYTAASATCSVTASFTLPLNDYTWTQISEISSSGQAANYFEVGDTKAITLSGTVGDLTLSNYTTYAFIIGINHNSTREGNNLIHFQIGKTALSGGKDICFVDGEYDTRGDSAAFRMNLSRTNSDGWWKSYMRTDLCGQTPSAPKGFYSVIHDSDLNLFNSMKYVKKGTDNDGGGGGSVLSNVSFTNDHVFLLSEYEVLGTIEYSNSYEANFQQQYAYYSAGNRWEKYNHTNTDSFAIWWLRSPNSSNSNDFICMNTSGDLNSRYANVSLAFSPCFCV